jgi:hypothetical protein
MWLVFAGDIAWSIFDSQEDLLENILDQTIPCGSLISNMEILICDEARNPVPIGTLGDLFVRTTLLSDFWLNQPKSSDLTFSHATMNGKHEDDWFRTDDSAFINAMNGLLYVKMERNFTSQNWPLQTDDEDCDELETESSVVLSLSGNDSESESESEEKVFFLEPEDITERNLEDALRIVVANTFLSAASDLPEFDQLTVSDLQDYAQQIIMGTLPRKMNFILRNQENQVVAVNIAFDPWATPQFVRNLMVSPESPKTRVVAWTLCPFTSTLSQKPGQKVQRVIPCTQTLTNQNVCFFIKSINQSITLHCNYPSSTSDELL